MTSEHTNAEKDICVIFRFNSDGYIELDLSKKQDRPNTGWEVFPLKKPCKVHSTIHVYLTFQEHSPTVLEK